MRLEKHFDVDRPPEQAAQILAEEETLVGLFPDAETQIVAREGPRRTVVAHYRILGREGEARFHFDQREDGSIGFEKVCDGHLFRELRGSVEVAPRGSGARISIRMQGGTKALVPEFTIKGPMRDQIEQMARALRERIESSR